MVMSSDETQIEIFTNWPMSHAKRVAKDYRENPDYHVVAVIGNCGQTKSVYYCSPLFSSLFFFGGGGGFIRFFYRL